MTDKLVEEAAQALCRWQLAKWEAAHIGETPAGEEPDDMRDGFRDMARAVIPIVRKHVLEEAAKVAERARDARAFEAAHDTDRAFVGARDEASDIAQAIRALSEEPKA